VIAIRSLFPGLLLVGIAAVALYAVQGLPGRSGDGLGPGSLPQIYAAALVVLGFAVAIEGARRKRVVMPAALAPALVVAAAGAAFMLTAGRLGLGVAAAVAALIVGGCGLRSRPKALALVAAVSFGIGIAMTLLMGASSTEGP
jgi:hypothetical protein